MPDVLRPPGVYVEKQDRPDYSLGIAKTGVPGLLGVATKGPVNEPTSVRSFEQYRALFGERVPGAYLYDSVRLFFENGGDECFILRVARTEKRKGIEVAAVAGIVCKDQGGKDTLAIMASSEGAWGNEIEVQLVVPTTPRVQTFLLQDIAEGSDTAVVKSARGILRGTVLRIHDGEREEHRTVIEVSGKRLRLDQAVDARFLSAAPTYLDPVEFTVVAKRRDKREMFDALSPSMLSARYYERFVNQTSKWIQLLSLDSPNPIPLSLPASTGPSRLVGGADGTAGLSPEDFIGHNNGPGERTGLGAFEALDEIDLLAAPDVMFAYQQSSRFRSPRDVEAVQDAMITHCELFRDRFAVLDLLPRAGFEEAQQWRLLFDSSYASLYYPWVVTDVGGKRRAVPPSGVVCGIIAQCDRKVGVHKPPANIPIEGVTDLAVQLNDAHLALLNNDGINTIRALPNRGIRIWGARTICSDPQWKYVNVRRIFTMIVRSISSGTQWTVFEPNNSELWGTISLNVREFMDRLHTNGYFQGRAASDAYFVKCDHETNPHEAIDAGQLAIEIGIAPVRPAEFITARIHHQMEEQGPGEPAE